MKYSEAKPGRIFVVRLEDGDVIHEEVEAFAKKMDIKAASLIVLGGADTKSLLVSGPEEGRVSKIVPMVHELEDVHEVSGTGTIFPDSNGNPSLHMHMACGREGKALVGCVRTGVKVWHVMEVVIYELVESTGVRKKDDATGFELLMP